MKVDKQTFDALLKRLPKAEPEKATAIAKPKPEKAPAAKSSQ
jgi:hypothetical protein